MRKLSDLPNLDGKRVVIRCDLNVPLDGTRITDDGRIVASVPTIKYLVDQGAKVVVISHLGRPEGAPDAKYSLEPAAKRLGELLGQPVFFASDTVGSEAKGAVKALARGGEPLRMVTDFAFRMLGHERHADRLQRLDPVRHVYCSRSKRSTLPTRKTVTQR